MQIAYPIYIIDIDGTVFSYDEIEARRFAPTIRRRTFAGRLHLPLHRQHVERIVDIDGEIHTITNRYIARDDHGRIITNRDWPFKPVFRHWGEPSSEVLHAQALGLPIPLTRCYKKGAWVSNKSGIGEVRRQHDDSQQLKNVSIPSRDIQVRRKRRSNGWWHDLDRKTQRCWKSQRKTQWK